MRTEMTLADTLHTLGLLGGTTLPRFVTDVGGRGDVLEVVADARAVNNLPGPLKMATRLVPAVRTRLRVEEFDGGVAVLSVDASAGGLPAHKLLGLAKSRIESVLAAKGLPPGSVEIRPDARIALDVQRLVAHRYPGTTVTNMTFADGQVAVDTAA
ncbi:MULTISPECIES: hypothetical protein [Isoptericola]|uniref:hypothetical protein n=1 Tax=Isoptericola TaxID=254250 RepID=UPI002713F632|nr:MULTISPECIES: hypothetical protein [unclassified Isoptericola]MDO8143960.1 hypothetical protein [Isoptericola sp. 178]MDO8149375.1 hypothetical protein [Isoptericola sp. b515]MDO8152322.1 hypothetical protein [Isoptericola sp. b408]